MNTPLGRWLLDIDVLPESANGLHVVFEHALPAWIWAVAALIALGFAVWSYSRMAGRRWVRGALAVLRGMIILCVLTLISAPALQLKRVSIEKDWLLVLLDRSASMNVKDVSDSDLDQRTSRDVQLHAAINDHQEVWSELSNDHRLTWLGFHHAAFELGLERKPIEDAASTPVDVGDATGTATNLNTALQQALRKAAARPVSSVVILSDGRTVDPPTRALVRRLQADAINVHVVPLGSESPVGDVAIRRVRAPGRAFVRDQVPVEIELDHPGSGAYGETVRVRLIDTLTGDVLDEQDVAASDERVYVSLTTRPDLSGEAEWRVEVETDAPDLVPENNIETVSIDLIDRPLRVLYVDGYPRWEYRYLKNLLVREKSIESSVMLLSADSDFAQEGNAPITRLPRSPEELAPYDVLIIGDLPGTFFSPRQVEMMRDHVALRGAGLLWIAGERFTPTSFGGSALADLLPLRGPLSYSAIGAPVNMRPTELAERLGLLRLSSQQGTTEIDSRWPDELSDPTFGWSQLWYAQRIDPNRLKPAAEVLAETVQTFQGESLPLVAHMRYGAGQIIYVATDDIWRWRYGRGERLPEQFWIQMVRMLGRESISGPDDPAIFEASPSQVNVGNPVRLSLRLQDSQLMALAGPTISAAVEDEIGETITTLQLKSQREGEQFSATYIPSAAGRLRVHVDDPLFVDFQLQTGVDVLRPNDELRQAEADHTLLENLATETDGQILKPDELDRLLDKSVVRNRSIRTNNPLTESIWDSPLAFGLLLLLLTMEWVGRRMIRLQ